MSSSQDYHPIGYHREYYHRTRDQRLSLKRRKRMTNKSTMIRGTWAIVRDRLAIVIRRPEIIVVYEDGTFETVALHMVERTQREPEITLEIVQKARTEAARPPPGPDCGGFLWAKLMEWCQKKGLAPSNENDLFSIVGEMRDWHLENTE